LLLSTIPELRARYYTYLLLIMIKKLPCNQSENPNEFCILLRNGEIMRAYSSNVPEQVVLQRHELRKRWNRNA
jgi:hypothetical protein